MLLNPLWLKSIITLPDTEQAIIFRNLFNYPAVEVLPSKESSRVWASIERSFPKQGNIPFEDFWELYDKKVGRNAAEKKWYKFPLEIQERIMAYIPMYKQAKPDKNYRKDPQTFFNNMGWEDEIIGAVPVIQMRKAVDPDEYMQNDRRVN